MDFETMDHFSEVERGGDLSTFAMLLLEPDGHHHQQQQQHHGNRDTTTTTTTTTKRDSGSHVTQRPSHLGTNRNHNNNNYNHHHHNNNNSHRRNHHQHQVSIDQYFLDRQSSISPDEPLSSNHLSPTYNSSNNCNNDGHCRMPSPSSPQAGGIRGFFRKRHKSVGNSSPSPGPGSQSEAETPPVTPSTAGGSKLKSLFFGSGRNKNKSDFAASMHEPVSRHSSLKQRHESNDVEPPSARRLTSSCYGDVIHEGICGDNDDDCCYYGGGGSYYGSSSRRTLLGANIYYTPQQQQNNYLHSPSAHSGSKHWLQKRSCSVRESAVGPMEFVEMFRHRANSELPKSQDLAKVSQARKMSGNHSNSSNSTPDYCPFEPRQVIIWKDSSSGTQVFRLPSNDDEEKMIRQSPDEGDSPDLAYYRFFKSHPCYDVMPTSTKLVVLDTFLTVKRAFLALNDNRIHAAPLWDTRKQDFIGMLTITDFIKVLLQCHREKTSILKISEDHTLAFWADTLFGPPRQALLHVTPDDSMYHVICKLLEYRIHRLPVVDPGAGNILYVLTLKRILRYLYLFFQHYDIPHPKFMNQTLSKLNIGTYGDLAVATMETKLVDALETIVERKISALPVVDEAGKLIGLFNKNLMMGLDSEEAYADLEISIGRIFNGSTLVKANTCLKGDFYQDIVGKIVNSEMHRVVVIDGVGRVEGIISCSDVMRHMINQWDEVPSAAQVVGSTSMSSEISDKY